jgi:hypothetical protein
MKSRPSKTCIDCSKEVIDYRSIRCKSCARAYWHKNNPKDSRIILVCLYCHKTFKRFMGEINSRRNKYCSLVCKNKSQINSKRSEETKQKIREKRKYQIITELTKKKIALKNKGRVHTIETKIKIGNAHRGKKCNFWKGGIVPLRMMLKDTMYNKEWIKSVYKRDGYLCQNCKKKSSIIDVHHIIPFYKILQEFLKQYSQFSPIEDKETLVRLAITYQPFWDISNGLTLCRKCHTQTDTYGKRMDLENENIKQ